MIYNLRPYQKEAVDRAVSFLKSPRQHNAIEVLPTGSGKSLVIANIAKELGEPTLIFQPSKEILEQNYNKLLSYGYTASVYSASMNQKDISEITFATIGSAKNNADLFRQFRHIVIDECHLVNAKGGMYRDFLKAIGESKVLGLTATPYRLASNSFGSELRFLTRTRPKIFHELLYYVQNQDLFDCGFLARLRYDQINGFDRTQLKLNSTGADFDDGSVRNYYRCTNFRERLVDLIKMLMPLRRNILVFTRFVEESSYLVDQISGAAIVTAETGRKEREHIIGGFRSGQIKAVCNVGILTTGFDYPELETIVLARPTMSLGLYYQMIGRGIRPHPQKDHTLVVDLCANNSQFGKIEDLKICNGGNGKWFVASGGKQLTNVYYGGGYRP